VDAAFVANMEDVLELYAEPPDSSRPVVCVDETLKQLVEDVKTPLPPRPGSTEKFDYHYRRNGTANLFVFVDGHAKWRHVKVTERKTNQDFAECMRDLVDIHYPTAQLIRVVLDNLSTHKPAALYEALPAQEARRILRRIEFYYTPKHASWLDIAEIEIGNLSKQCLNRRIGDIETLRAETAAWEDRRNAEGLRPEPRPTGAEPPLVWNTFERIAAALERIADRLDGFSDNSEANDALHVNVLR
jgi:hypothetical protein